MVLTVGDGVMTIISRWRRAEWAARKDRSVVMRRQRLQTARQRSTDSDGRRTRISMTASSQRPPNADVSSISSLSGFPLDRPASIDAAALDIEDVT
jgi:hypothetical protein